ncbi:ABC transporter permease [Chitinophaga sp. GbtcB8]|uniref:ABC transporter permease n=1 Tax=Chitinophaga sp. GbtcB8 TaxID=2824753 RepID=UPI001C305159|nr:ABC transporter permease [Chitinophaga sp. GbtcB8]
MFKSFIRATFRHLWKNKTYTFLNIFGLATGIVCAAFIFLWIEDELHFDSQYPKKDQLYMILTNQTYDGKTRAFRSSPAKLAAAIKTDIPGVVNTARVNSWKSVFSVGEKAINETGCYTDAAFFDMMDLQFLEGTAKNAFKDVSSIVVTEDMARRFFGSAANAMGKSLQMEHKESVMITGVVKNFAPNSSLQFSCMVPFNIASNQHDYYERWGANAVNTYVELSPRANLAAVSKQLSGLIRSKDPDAGAVPFLFAMNDWRLRSEFPDGVQKGGRIVYVRMFSIIAWIILLIACINFMNLATARSEKRAREVGVRKVMGAGKQVLALQFIGEAICMALLSALIAVVLMYVMLPGFNLLVEKKLALGLLQPAHAGFLLGIALLCGLVAGSYPSLYLSSFSPIKVLKGFKMKAGSAAYIRKGLVVFQFATSIVLIVSTIIIYQQIRHVTHRDLGYNKDHLIQAEVKGDLYKHFGAIKQALLQTGAVENAGLASSEMLYTSNNTSGFTWQGKDPQSDVLISFRDISPELFSTWGMQIVEGRSFYDNIKSDSGNVIITASLARLMGKGSAIGKTLQLGDGVFHVVGVLKDFVYGDMYLQSDPVVFFSRTDNAEKLLIRLKPDAATEAAIAKISAVVQQAVPGYPFDYKFVDDQFQEFFKSEQLASKLSRLFALLAIIISCLGIFGLAAYMAERRVKEIGVRKVLGASVASITTLLSKDFLQLVLLASFIAMPVGWWVMDRWLEGYAYHINISAWVFVLAGCMALLIALFTISFQSVKAAMANPVKSLRTE